VEKRETATEMFTKSRYDLKQIRSVQDSSKQEEKDREHESMADNGARGG
jgi:hypothetical protein